jgi:hypothetical protein
MVDKCTAGVTYWYIMPKSVYHYERPGTYAGSCGEFTVDSEADVLYYKQPLGFVLGYCDECAKREGIVW